MYKINRSTNRITPIQSKRFVDLEFREREHLQEWLVYQPDALGEELLIIQKEFDGFDDTRERLDLLALDKNGNLVVVENKLDDTGRDVMWQALKYASYCSSLSKAQIIEIYQKYLDRYCEGGDAKALLCDFLDVPELEEVVLNSGTNQRLMLVAAHFRKEVTSTVLWLLSYNIQVQCIKVTPYAMGDDLFLNIEQIIPTPEAQELMIGMSVKEAEEKNTEVELKSRHKIRLAFWEHALEAMKSSPCDLFNNINPGKDHWSSAGSGVRSCPYSLIFGAKFARVELCLARSESSDNKFIFDALFERKESIEAGFGCELEWLRLDSKISSKIQYNKSFDGFNKENWPEIIEWLVDHMIKLEKSFKGPVQEVGSLLKNGHH